MPGNEFAQQKNKIKDSVLHIKHWGSLHYYICIFCFVVVTVLNKHAKIVSL